MPRHFEKEFKDLKYILRILIKAAIFAVVVYVTLSLTRMVIELLSVTFGNHWFKTCIEFIHEGSSIIVFLFSSIRDLLDYSK